MPFRSVISRDSGTPWPDMGMTTDRWMAEVKPTIVAIADLIATQPSVVLSALHVDYTRPGGEPWAKDALPHVVQWRGSLYLEDGHHRAVRALLRGETTMEARVLTL